MTWGLVGYVKRLAVMASGNRVRDRHARQRAMFGPVKPTEAISKPSGKPSITLTARAYRLHNKNRERAERYLKTHAVLSRGR